MARRKSPTFTEVELEFLHIIWDRGKVTTEEMQDTLREQGRDLTDGSIRKILSILMTKGHLTRKRKGRNFIYRAKVQKKQAPRNMVQDLLKRAFDGSVSHMAAALLDSRDIKAGDIEELKRLIDEFEREQEK